MAIWPLCLNFLRAEILYLRSDPAAGTARWGTAKMACCAKRPAERRPAAAAARQLELEGCGEPAGLESLRARVTELALHACCAALG